MTIQECYQELGGSYEEVAARLPSAKLIERFLLRFPEDPSFNQLLCAVENGSREEAFRAAHTLKGVCANLSLERLRCSADKLTELLRAPSPSLPQKTDALLEQVRQDYAVTVDAIRRYQGQG